MFVVIAHSIYVVFKVQKLSLSVDYLWKRDEKPKKILAIMNKYLYKILIDVFQQMLNAFDFHPNITFI